jgi:hypothetical protein
MKIINNVIGSANCIAQVTNILTSKYFIGELHWHVKFLLICRPEIQSVLQLSFEG